MNNLKSKKNKLIDYIKYDKRKIFIKYVLIGLLISLINAVLTVITSRLFNDNMKLLFIINFIIINIGGFMLKYYLSKKFRILST